MEDETKPKTPLLNDQDLLDKFSNIVHYENADDPAFKKWLYRLRKKTGKAKLKSVRLGKKRGYRPEDVDEWIKDNASHYLLRLANRTNKPAFRKMKVAATSNDQDEHDPNDLRWFHDFMSGKVNKIESHLIETVNSPK